MKTEVIQKILAEVARHPNGIAMMNVIRPFLGSVPENTLRSHIAKLAAGGMVRMEKVGDRVIVLYPKTTQEADA